MPTQITWDPATTALLGILAYIVRKVGEQFLSTLADHTKRIIALETTVITEDDCDKRQAKCEQCPDWHEFKKHYHTGLGPESGVVIKD